MLSHSAQYLLFLSVVFALYWSVHAHRRLRLGVLLGASLVFYAAWIPAPLVLFASMAGVNYVAALALGRTTRVGARKVILAGAVLVDLGALGLFKYADLFYATAVSLAGRLGSGASYTSLGLLLPLGLSFFTFMAISYVVDVYRGVLRVEHNYFELLTHLIFFPQLVSGPIARGSSVLARLRETPRLDAEQGTGALFRISTGLIKKLLIADVLAAGLVDQVYVQPSLFTSAEVVVATIAYTLQIYYDFSGYTDIAIGSAALFGFALPENFNRPYLSRNLFEFWNRWHMSLSTWLRDYLYFPLGGSQGSRLGTLRNLMIVMLLGGLWHGSSWKFAVWGGVHGVGLVLTRWWLWARGKDRRDLGASAGVAMALGVTATFSYVVLSRVFFRAPDVPAALVVYARMLEGTWGLANVTPVVWATMAVGVLLHLSPPAWYGGTQRLFGRLPIPARAAALAGLALAIRHIGAVEVQPYVYFQF